MAPKGNEIVKPDYRVVLAGGRDFADYDLLRTSVLSFLGDKIKTRQIVVVSGHARGADSLGERFAAEFSFSCELHEADWKAHGRAAGIIRNEQMATCSDALVAFWDGRSRGTKSMIDFARLYGLDVRVVNYS